MIRFFFKIFFVLVIALAAVVYHNTDSGREMERRIGQEISVERLAERAKTFFSKVMDSLLLKGMNREEGKDAAPGGKEKRTVTGDGGGERGKKPPSPASSTEKKGPVKEKKVEKIADEDRKKLEEIIESAGSGSP